LLRVCRALLPPSELTPAWRGRPLAIRDIAAAATASLKGETSSTTWLESLQDGRAMSFFAETRAEFHALRERFQTCVEKREQAWDDVIGQGAPAQARPTAVQSLAEAVQLEFLPDASARLRQQAFDFFNPQRLLLRARWFLTFGTQHVTMNVQQLAVLRALEDVSLIMALNEAQLHAVQDGVIPEGDRPSVTMSAIMGKLLHGLIIRPGTPVVDLQGGDTHCSEPADSSYQHVRGHFRRFKRWIVDLVIRLYRRFRPDDPLANLNLDAQLVRMTTDHQVPHLPPHQDEQYLMLVTWSVPQRDREPRVTLCLDQPGPVLATPRYRMRNLPREGRVQLVLAGDSRIRLYFKYSRWLPALGSRPISVYFHPLARMRRADPKMHSARTTMTAAWEHLSTVNSTLQPALGAVSNAETDIERASNTITTHTEFTRP